MDRGQKGGGWQKPVSVRLYTPITPHLLPVTLPQPNISYDGNRCATCGTIVIVVMQMFTHVQISKIILYHHIPLTVSAQKKYSS